MAAQETLAPFPLIFGPLSFSSLSRGRAAVPATGTREAAEIFLSICLVPRGTTESSTMPWSKHAAGRHSRRTFDRKIALAAGDISVYFPYRMEFEYDPTKSQINKEKHGVDFDEAQALWLDEDRVEFPARSDTEERHALVAMKDGRVWVAFYTVRETSIRIISVRRARENEEKTYYDS